MLRRIWDTARWLAFAFVVLVLAELANELGPLQELETYFERHQQPWRGLAIISTVVGWGLLIYVWGSLIFSSSRRPSRNEASFSQIKEAFRNGNWLLDPSARPFCIGVIGLVVTMIGMFGFGIVNGPPAAILVCSAALAYALIRIGWGMIRA